MCIRDSLYTTGIIPISAYVKDSRGISSLETITDQITVYAYAAPYITSVTAERYTDVTYTYTIQEMCIRDSISTGK